MTRLEQGTDSGAQPVAASSPRTPTGQLTPVPPRPQ